MKKGTYIGSAYDLDDFRESERQLESGDYVEVSSVEELMENLEAED